MLQLRRRLLLALLTALAVTLTPASLAAARARATPLQQPAITLNAQPAYGGVYRPRGWLPIMVELENSGPDRAVEVQIGARGGAQYAVDLDLPNGGRKLAVVYVYLPTSTPRLQVRLLSDGAELQSTDVRLLPTPALARVIGVIAAPGAAPRLPARLASGAVLVTVPLSMADLPERAEGLSSFDTLILDDIAGADLGVPQRAALREWVLRGGQVIIGGGPGAARALVALPEMLRPAILTDTPAIPAAALLGPEAGDAALPVVAFQPLPDASGRLPYPLPTTGLSQDFTLAIEQTYGRGVVTLVALPLAHPALIGWAELPQLWEDLLHEASMLPAGFAPDGMSLDTFIDGNLAGTLTSLPALAFPPLLMLVLLLSAYILLVGPCTYLVLRRLDRQSLGWVVVPLLTLLFAGLTYSLGHAQRGGDVLVNQVTLVEPLGSDEQAARVRSFAGVFSPGQTDYRLLLSNPPGETQPLLRPISVQGPWDTSTAAMGGVFVQEAPSGAQIRGFTVAQWSMRAVAADTISAYAGLSATVTVVGDTLHGEVVNHSGRSLEDVTLVQGDRAVRLGAIQPGERLSGALERRPNPAGQPGTMPLSYLLYGEQIDINSKAGGQPLPPEIQLKVRLLDALFAYGPVPQSGQPLLVAWSRDPELAIQPDALRAELQHMALITATPRIVVDGEQIDLARGWLAPTVVSSQANLCYSALGTGVTIGPDPIIMQLQLPRDLYGLRPSELTLVTGADGPWLPEQVVELYDWQGGAWVAQPANGQPLTIAQPDRFLSSHGRVRVRLSNTLAQPNFGCVYADVQLKGTMP